MGLRFRSWIFIIISILALSACAPPVNSTSTALPAQSLVTPSLLLPSLPPSATATTQPSATLLPPTGAPTPKPTSPPAPVVCSPLADILISELGSADLFKNPFQPPRAGMDDGHHGVDFAYWSRGERTTMRGHPIQSVMTGKVISVIKNREPYGYALIIETPLDAIPASRLETISIPEPAPTVQPAASLYCPSMEAFNSGSNGQRSLYLLYAHMNALPDVEINQTVQCGQTIGSVGTTGKSVNDHLHLETRVGPAGISLPEMAHYENDATDEEMRAYCVWRVSGLFQMFDPMLLFQDLTLQP